MWLVARIVAKCRRTEVQPGMEQPDDTTPPATIQIDTALVQRITTAACAAFKEQAHSTEEAAMNPAEQLNIQCVPDNSLPPKTLQKQPWYINQSQMQYSN